MPFLNIELFFGYHATHLSPSHLRTYIVHLSRMNSKDRSNAMLFNPDQYIEVVQTLWYRSLTDHEFHSILAVATIATQADTHLLGAVLRFRLRDSIWRQYAGSAFTCPELVSDPLFELCLIDLVLHPIDYAHTHKKVVAVTLETATEQLQTGNRRFHKRKWLQLRSKGMEFTKTA